MASQLFVCIFPLLKINKYNIFKYLNLIESSINNQIKWLFRLYHNLMNFHLSIKGEKCILNHLFAVFLLEIILIFNSLIHLFAAFEI